MLNYPRVNRSTARHPSHGLACSKYGYNSENEEYYSREYDSRSYSSRESYSPDYHEQYRAQPTHHTPLSADEEVDFVLTKAKGNFVARVDRCGLKFKLFVNDLDQVTQSHIHLGKCKQNGPVVAFLFGLSPPTCEVNGLLSEGVITEADLMGPLAGKSLRLLLKLINEGKAYVNVHTVLYPEGELRGQIKSVGPTKPTKHSS